MASGRIFFDLFLLAGAAWGFAMGRTLPDANSPGQIGPAFFPTVVAGLGIMIILGILWGDVKTHRTANAQDAASVDRKTAIGAGAVFVVLVAYILAIPVFGFLLSTVIFLFAVMMICNFTLDIEGKTKFLDPRFAAVAGFAAILSTFVTYAVFTYGFGLNLS